MVEIQYSNAFVKKHNRLVKYNPGLRRRIERRIDLFQINPNHNSLHSHKLSGRDIYSFSLTGDLRILYRWEDGEALFFDIGTHDEVYRKNR